MLDLRRSQFITLLCGAAAAWPLAARAQQPAVPVIGYFTLGAPEQSASYVAPFRRGLSEVGYVEGQNVVIEYRWAHNEVGRLPALATDLVRRRVAVIIATGGLGPALAAKAATTTIPIVFNVAEDPVGLGLVASLARPGSNLTGINFYSQELAAKRLELLHELVPVATRVAVLVNPDNARITEITLKDADTAARAMGLQIQVFNASTNREIEGVFATLTRERPDALFVGNDGFFNSRRVQLATLAARDKIPAAYSNRDHVEAGGLMTYGTEIADAYRQVGAYAGRILKGAKPAALPVVQSSKL